MANNYYIEFEKYNAAMEYVEEFCGGNMSIINIDDDLIYINKDDIRKYEDNEGVIVQVEKKDYEVWFVNSANTVSSTFVQATSKDNAAKRTKRYLGQECKYIMDIYEI